MTSLNAEGMLSNNSKFPDEDDGVDCRNISFFFHRLTTWSGCWPASLIAWDLFARVFPFVCPVRNRICWSRFFFFLLTAMIFVRLASYSVTWRQLSSSGFYAASSGNFLSTFRDNLSVASSGVLWFLNPEDGTVRLFRNVGKIINTRCFITQKGAVLSYFVAEVWNCARSREYVGASINAIK